MYLKNTLFREETEKKTVKHHQRDHLSCYYGLRENPKKKTFELESPEQEDESMKKILFRCEECGKGFRYEKCLSNHRAGVHYEESMESLWSSFSLVKRKKRSRVMRYKKKTMASLLSSLSFLESSSVPSVAVTDEELEVAECLILLSLSSPMDADLDTPRGSSYYEDSGCFGNKRPRKDCEFESGGFSNEQKKRVLCSCERSNEPASFLGHKRELASFLGHKRDLASYLGEKKEITAGDQQQSREAFALESEFLSQDITTGDGPSSFLGQKRELADFLGEKKELKQRKSEPMFLNIELGVETMECCDSDTEIETESSEKKKKKYNDDEQHQCRLCNKMFSSYQALGGHQTFHRISKSSNKKKKGCREESVNELEEEDDELKKKRHKCSICSRLFSSGHALGGHKKGHCSKRQHFENRA